MFSCACLTLWYRKALEKGGPSLSSRGGAASRQFRSEILMLILALLRESLRCVSVKSAISVYVMEAFAQHTATRPCYQT